MDIAGYIVEALIFVVFFSLADKILEWLNERREREAEEMFIEHEEFFKDFIANSMYASSPNLERYKLSDKEKYGK